MRLGVNIDHVATLRQARLPKGKQAAPGSIYPDPVMAARICKKIGVHSVVMHLREDRRHIQDSDVFRVRSAVRIKLNLEMSIAPSVMKTALRLAPDQATLVPEKRQERTTEGGLDVCAAPASVARAVSRLKKKGVLVSLFLDPDERQIRAAKKVGADAVELHTGDYANATTASARRRELSRLRHAAEKAAEMGFAVHAGHGLDYENVSAVTRIRVLDELNIGYSIVARSLWTGFEAAVREMRRLVR